jgi:hypothetical protein
MAQVNWRRYHSDFNILAEEMHQKRILNPGELDRSLQALFRTDPQACQTRLGVPSYQIGFLEYLFSKAEGPYTPEYHQYESIIGTLFTCSEPLRSLINRNAADAIGNMILNRRGRLKFTIADGLELDLILSSWEKFGLTPVGRRDIFDAILGKASVCRQMMKQEPELILKLADVFPEYQSEFWPRDLSREDLEKRLGSETGFPSRRRYRRIYQQQVNRGISLEQMIQTEEGRALPLQARRNSFLAFLVKQLHQGRCQLCAAGMKALPETPVTVHHIVPLSEGGDDSASNMLVLCKQHHQAVHQGIMTIHAGHAITVSSGERIISLEPNRNPGDPGHQDNRD